jgi:hypothetical protein
LTIGAQSLNDLSAHFNYTKTWSYGVQIAIASSRVHRMLNSQLIHE